MLFVTRREYQLAELIFGAHRIAEARRATFPQKRLMELMAAATITGAYSARPVFEDVYGWALEGTRVRFYGATHEALIFETTLERLAQIATQGLYQESFLEMLK